MNIKEKLIHLHHCRGAGWKTIQTIYSLDPTFSRLYHFSFNEWKDLLPLSSKNLLSFYKDLHSLDIAAKLKQYENLGIECLTILDKDYPYLLGKIYDPPWVLYVKGNKELLTKTKPLGVIGSRKPTAYGLGALNKILIPLIYKKFMIISGVAAGMDAAAHQITLANGGDTIGVLGGGLLKIYPRSNIPLAMDISQRGLLLSEIPPERRAEPWMFPLRNRIISGLSLGIFVVEAKEKSGSLITAHAALDQGRDVFALPGNVSNLESVGTNRLILEGAKLVMTAEQIEEEYRAI